MWKILWLVYFDLFNYCEMEIVVEYKLKRYMVVYFYLLGVLKISVVYFINSLNDQIMIKFDLEILKFFKFCVGFGEGVWFMKQSVLGKCDFVKCVIFF